VTCKIINVNFIFFQKPHIASQKFDNTNLEEPQQSHIWCLTDSEANLKRPIYKKEQANKNKQKQNHRIFEQYTFKF